MRLKALGHWHYCYLKEAGMRNEMRMSGPEINRTRRILDRKNDECYCEQFVYASFDNQSRGWTLFERGKGRLIEKREVGRVKN